MNKQKQISAVTAIGAAINLALFFTKLYIGLSVNSVAVYADAINNLFDSLMCIASAAAFFAFSKKKADYPYGFGKAEELMEFIISVFILAAGFGFAYASLERILYPIPVWHSTVYSSVIAATAGVKFLLYFMFKTYSKKRLSPVIDGFASDSLLDFLITLCTFISLVLGEHLSFSADGFAGIIIGVILSVHGIRSALSAAIRLIGKKDGNLCDKATEILESFDEIIAVTELESHSYGNTKIITAKVKTNCKTAEEIVSLTKETEKKFDRELKTAVYLGFGE